MHQMGPLGNAEGPQNELFVCLFVCLAEYVMGFRSSMEGHCLV